MTQKTAITLRASAEVLKVLDAKAGVEFCSRAEAGAMMLQAACAEGGEPLKPSPMAGVKERSASVDLEVKELRLRQLRKELIPVEDAVRVVEECFAGQRVEGHTLMNDIADEFGLDPEKLRRRFDERMVGAFTVERDPFEKIADEFSQAPLPA